MRNVKCLALLCVLCSVTFVFTQTLIAQDGDKKIWTTESPTPAKPATPPPKAVANDTATSSTPAATSATTAPTTTQATTATTKVTKDDSEKTRATIKYGIESELTDLIASLSEKKDSRYNTELSALLDDDAVSPKVKASIYYFFAGLAWSGAETQAVTAFSKRETEDTQVVNEALHYLAAVKSKALLTDSANILASKNKNLIPPYIRYMGQVGGSSEEEALLKILNDPEQEASVREETVRALGGIGSTTSIEALSKIATDEAATKVLRMNACEALGKLKDESAVPALIKASKSEDINVKGSAISALGSYTSEEARKIVIAALRDPNVGVRVLAVKASAGMSFEESGDIISYKAKNDPERSVKTEALRVLAAMNAPAAFAFLRDYYSDEKNEPPLRVTAFGLLMRKDATNSMNFLATSLASEKEKKDRSMYTALAREIANANDAPAATPLARILLSDKDFLLRLGALEWAKKNKVAEFKADLSTVATSDPSEAMRKQASKALEAYDIP